MYKALIVDDHPVIRFAVKTLLLRERYDVLGETDNGIDAIQLTRELQPDVVILDIGIPRLDGLEVIARLKTLDSPPRILVLTGRDPGFFSRRCLQAGASGYLSKDEDLAELISALRAVMSGYSYFPDLTFNMTRGASALASEEERLHKLTDRELEVLQHLAVGRSNAEIAEAMLLSHKTISTYKTRIMDKLQVRSLVEMLEMAKRNAVV